MGGLLTLDFHVSSSSARHAVKAEKIVDVDVTVVALDSDSQKYHRSVERKYTAVNVLSRPKGVVGEEARSSESDRENAQPYPDFRTNRRLIIPNETRV